ncbi:uncharacterized protein LOC112682734 [Sipha flava]|uniref:Uncharacterized protein LOC112682734 n=1 Tax=Sipha flava TaxID=143950 RepID=A0A8B8FFF5_9HEMI|nr:uncharacterized protein LOC112682734 [Sipha flava]
MTIIRPMVTYGCEIWPTTIQLEKKLLVFEYKILRKICGPMFDSELNKWRRRKNTELGETTEVLLLTSHIKCQRLKWFGHNMRKTETHNTRAAFEWQQTGKRPRERSRKRWVDGIRKDWK